MPIIRTAALTFIVLLSACSRPETASTDAHQQSLPQSGDSTGPATPPVPAPTQAANSLYSPLEPNGQVTLIHCRMGSCSWGKWLSVKSLSSSDSQQVLEATLLDGSSHHENAEELPSSPDGVAIHWSSEPRTFKVTCSHTNPSVSDAVLPLNSETGLPGAAESAANLYFAVCHSYFGGYSTGIEKFSYDVKK